MHGQYEPNVKVTLGFKCFVLFPVVNIPKTTKYRFEWLHTSYKTGHVWQVQMWLHMQGHRLAGVLHSTKNQNISFRDHNITLINSCMKYMYTHVYDINPRKEKRPTMEVVISTWFNLFLR